MKIGQIQTQIEFPSSLCDDGVERTFFENKKADQKKILKINSKISILQTKQKRCQSNRKRTSHRIIIIVRLNWKKLPAFSSSSSSNIFNSFKSFFQQNQYSDHRPRCYL